ncbi:uncharacterized protein LOC122043848 [Zingiber officinale]|uniref:uncharacterized protein LOC122043848 n=1 Tax=Zingiber officinale TaxID=94328 RepID=UPI001C4C45F2|nr:uncharacterized protein LOC122043848 [Zingiber officinale]
MKIGSWNVRGLNSGLKQREVRSLLLKCKLSALCIMEPNLTHQRHQHLKTHGFQQWSSEQRVCINNRSRMLLFWDSQLITLEIKEWKDQYIHTLIQSKVAGTFYAVTFIYGQLSVTSRRSMWEDLHRIATSMELPWLIMGDFNSPLSPMDKCGGMDVTSYATADFLDFVIRAGMEDLHATGCQFTWTNGRVVCKLDRAMVNKIWLEQDRSSVVEFRPPGIFSDHASCIISILELQRPQAKPFKFYNMWTTHQDFGQLVHENWTLADSMIREGVCQFKLKQKLLLLKKPLRQLNKESYQHIQERAKRAQIHLEEVQERVLTQGSVDEEYTEARKAADLLSQAEYLFYQQRAKHAYFNQVDRNTPFFHSLVKRNNKRREIVAIEKDDGVSTTSPQKVAQTFVRYYQELLGTQVVRASFQAECM